MLAPMDAIWLKLVQLAPEQRSILKPSLLVALSVQARSIRFLEIAEATRLLGETGQFPGLTLTYAKLTLRLVFR
jgi:hypothetical protein